MKPDIKAAPGRKPAAPFAAPENAFPWPSAGLAARLLLGAVFLYSGLHKAAAPAEEFGAVLEAYYILPDTHVLLVAHVLPWAELLTGAFLAAGLFTGAAAGSAGTMLATFMSAMLYTLYRGIPLENCGCFGSSIHLTPWQAVVFDSCLLGLAVLAFRHGRAIYSLDNWADAGE